MTKIVNFDLLKLPKWIFGGKAFENMDHGF